MSSFERTYILRLLFDYFHFEYRINKMLLKFAAIILIAGYVNGEELEN